jgi:hypothetical protein
MRRDNPSDGRDGVVFAACEMARAVLVVARGALSEL